MIPALPPSLALILAQITPPSPEIITATGTVLKDLETVKIVIMAVFLITLALISAVVYYLVKRDKNKDIEGLELRIHDLENECKLLRTEINRTQDQTLDLLSKNLSQTTQILRLKPAIEKALEDGHENG